MRPEVDVPQALGKLVDLFCIKENPLVEFSHMHMEAGRG
jgi:hypothetical protein